MLRAWPSVCLEFERLLRSIGSSNLFLDDDCLALELRRLLPVLVLVAVIVYMR